MLERLDLSLTMPRDEYDRWLKILQADLHELAYQVYLQKLPVVLIFEGMDASGKGGTIKRLTEKMDPRGYVVWPIAAPHGDDRERHYLYRFWRRLPEQGQIAIFDRSWYGRVLVERLEGFCSEEAWRRAYSEINQFERQFTDFGGVIFKFWMHISKEEQLERFRERERVNYKSWKITDEDWRNRAKWEDYQEAARDMVLKTSTQNAPWTLVEANDKPFSRIKVLRTVAEKLRRALNPS
jgi:AMP-polyphosphate phosphotransferase